MFPKRTNQILLVVTVLTVFAHTTWAGHLRGAPNPSQTRQNPSRLDKPPRIEDTLAVAKSPFEPVTVAHSLTDARHNEPSRESLLLETTKSLQEESSEENAKRTTRAAAQDATDQQQDSSSSTKGMDENTGLQEASESSTKSIRDESSSANNQPPTTAPSLTTTTTAAESTETDSATDSTASDEETTTTASVTTTTPEPAAAVTTEVPVTTTTSTTAAPTTTEQPTTAPPTEAPTEPPATTTTTETPVAEVVKIQTPSETTTVPPPTTTAAPESAVTTKVEESEKEAADNADEKPTTTDGAATTPATEAPSVTENEDAKPDPATDKPEKVEKEESVPALAPVTTTVAPEPEAPTTTTTTSAPEQPSTPREVAPSTPGSPISDQQQQNNNRPFCNHLPTYGADEVQKVFREETTFKNGTIKGKFTYINFDQRYRLVHYTRLPYGPVKIDFVEELGRPEQSNPNQSTPLSANEIPNAVLQLRNILPNSLFGFPFTGPNTAGQVRPPPGSSIGPRDGLTSGGPNPDDNSNMYFYSTDSISTPNLLTPTVPVSLLPQQKPNLAQASANSPSADTIGQSFLQDQHSNQAQPIVAAKRPPVAAHTAGPLPDSKPKELTGPLNHQFQYAEYSSNPQSPEQNHKNMIYTYLTQAPGLQYQYSPLPMLRAPHASAQARALLSSPPYPAAYPHNLGGELKQPTEFHHQFNAHTSYHHQPHGHEHFVAPFMFAQQQQSAAPAGEPKVRLRVKATKSLNHSGTKSAQLRLQSQGHSSVPSTSPAQAVRLQQRQQRLGKQNHELKNAPSSPTVNTSPVVYHVLRSPLGQVYSLPQYGSQSYAVAYDQNNQQ